MGMKIIFFLCYCAFLFVFCKILFALEKDIKKDAQNMNKNKTNHRKPLRTKSHSTIK